MERQTSHAAWATLIRREFATSAPGRDKLDAEAVYAAAKQLEDLVAHPGWEVLGRLVARKRSQAIGALTGQRVLDQAEYVAHANSVRSLDEVMQAPLVLLSIADEVRRIEERLIEAQEENSGV